MAKSINQNNESFYSFSARRNLRKEEVAAYKRIAIATIVVVGLLAAGYFWGVPLIAQMGGDSVNLSDKDKLGTTDNIPPTSPKLDTIPEFVRVRQLTIKGSAESGATVVLRNNDQELATFTADKDGLFQGEITLEAGLNTLSATAQDAAGNTSRATKSVTITFDATPPKLTLSSEPNSVVTTSRVTFKGKVESGSTVTINNRLTVLADDDSFESEINLSPGANTITIIATDQAGNINRISRTVTLEQPSQASPSASLE